MLMFRERKEEEESAEERDKERRWGWGAWREMAQGPGDRDA